MNFHSPICVCVCKSCDLIYGVNVNASRQTSTEVKQNIWFEREVGSMRSCGLHKQTHVQVQKCQQKQVQLKKQL